MGSFIKTGTIIPVLIYPSLKAHAGKIYFHKKLNFVTYCAMRELYGCDIIEYGRVPPESVTYKNSMKTLKNHNSWLDCPNLLKLCFNHWISRNARGNFSFKYSYSKVTVQKPNKNWQKLMFELTPPCQNIFFFFQHWNRIIINPEHGILHANCSSRSAALTT